MSCEYEWEKKGRTGSCRCCGQFIKDGEKYYLVIINGGVFSKKYPKETNFIVHKDEFDQLANEHNDEYMAIDTILSRKRPNPKNHTAVDEKKVEKFYEVAKKLNLRIIKETRNRIYFKPSVRGRVGDFYYDKRSQKVSYNGRGFNGIFERMLLREIISRIHEELHDLKEGYRVEQSFAKAKQIVNEMK